MSVPSEFLDTQISLGDVITHLTTLAVLGAYIARNHAVWNRIKDRQNMLWQKFCEEHELEYTPLEKE